MTRLKGRHWSCITTFNKIDRDGAFSFERHLSDLDYQYQNLTNSNKIKMTVFTCVSTFDVLVIRLDITVPTAFISPLPMFLALLVNPLKALAISNVVAF